MYDELVKQLRTSADWADRLALLMGREEGDTHAPIMRQAADAIEELSRAQEQWIEQERNALLKSIPRWIPVTERLPDKPGIYAVWTAKGFGNHLSASYFDGDSWSLRITHWMPLPEPPKEE